MLFVTFEVELHKKCKKNAKKKFRIISHSIGVFFLWTLFVETKLSVPDLGTNGMQTYVMFDHGGIGRASVLLGLVIPSH